MVNIAFPLGGWNTNAPRNSQPDNTSASLLNAVPFDRDYRDRGAIRSGLSKFASTQMGNGSQPVLLTEQVTVALDPSTITVNTSLVSETFAYSNGYVGAVSSGVWTGSAASAVWNGTDANYASVSSNTLVYNTSSFYGVKYNPTLSLGDAYIVKCTASFASVSSIHQVGILFRQDPATPGNTLVLGVGSTLNSTDSKMNVYQGISGSSLGTDVHVGSLISAGVPFTLELHVNGNNIAGYLNGILQFSCTSSLYSTTSGVGLEFDSDGSNAVTVTNFQVLTGQPLASFRKTSTVSVCGGNVYVGDTSGLTLAVNGSGVLSTTVKPQMSSASGFCFLTDSLHNLKVLNLATQTISDIATTAGLETASTLGAYSLTCVWRDRLVLAASAAYPMNFIMSRQGILPGTNVDFDYSQLDAAAAVAGNASRAGAIGDPLNCLMPWTDDVLILGGDHTIYKVEGDIAAGGQILVVSEAVGTLGPDCWDVDPIGNLYFVGTDGLYKMTAGSPPTNISDSIKDYFVAINRSNTYVVLAWDRDRNGLWIFLTPVNAGAATHIFYDATTNGFFPIQFPNSMGPMSACVFDGSGPLDRQLLLGGRDGYLRKVDPASLTDDGTSISSYVQIGPFRPAGDAALSVLEAMEVILGDAPSGFSESQFGLTITINAGKDAYTVLTNPQTSVSTTFTQQSRRKRLLQRISGGSFMFEVTGTAGKLWSMEKLVALFTEGGLQRRY